MKATDIKLQEFNKRKNKAEQTVKASIPDGKTRERYNAWVKFQIDWVMSNETDRLIESFYKLDEDQLDNIDGAVAKAKTKRDLSPVGTKVQRRLPGRPKGSTKEKNKDKVKKERDPLAPKRPISSFLFYRKWRAAQPNNDDNDKKKYAEEWYALTDEEKQSFNDLATVDQKRYKSEKLIYDQNKILERINGNITVE